MTCRGHKVLRKLASKRADPNRPREAGSPTFQAAYPSNAAEYRSARSCDVRSHVVSECVEGGWQMPET